MSAVWPLGVGLFLELPGQKKGEEFSAEILPALLPFARPVTISYCSQQRHLTAELTLTFLLLLTNT